MDEADFHGRRLNFKLSVVPEKGDDNIRAMLKKSAVRRWQDRRLRKSSLGSMWSTEWESARMEAPTHRGQ